MANDTTLSFARLLKFDKKKQKYIRQQQVVLHKLLRSARKSAFGKEYHFEDILDQKNLIKSFQQKVPISDYMSMKPWWTRCFNGEKGVVQKGKIKYFALSSGTSDGASKYIPVAKKQLSQLTRQSLKFMFKVALNKKIPAQTFTKHNLLIGGSTALTYNGFSYSGDLSGIAQKNIPFWYHSFSKPGKDIMVLPWEDKIEQMILDAPNWHISIITGIPSWVQLILERIIKHHKLKNIHEIWPDLKVYIHSGIRAEPYFKSINQLFGEEVFWYESYMASEGLFAFKTSEHATGMKLILNDEMFFEFIPFNEQNFDESGNFRKEAQAITIDQVQENIDYALLITTCSGAWRYLIGDTVRFTNAEKAEIVVSGRTKHYLSVTGEHLSIDNMNHAIEFVCDKLNFKCKEFTVYAEPIQAQFKHIWHIGCDKKVDEKLLKRILDEKLKELNDDYRTERIYALKDIEVKIIPNEVFYQFLEKRGKTGGQIKFPRVLKGSMLEDWKKFIKES